MVIKEILNMKDGLERLSKLERIYEIEFIKSEEEFNKLPKDKIIHLYTISGSFQASSLSIGDALAVTYVGLTRKECILKYKSYNYVTVVELNNGTYLGGALLAIDTL